MREMPDDAEAERQIASLRLEYDPGEETVRKLRGRNWPPWKMLQALRMMRVLASRDQARKNERIH
ncbi:MAG TPA: hypothetical protein PK539_02290 [Candidatus Paceibacterota bacterium]|nr:hypothetical protein [Candidatus Paceibacterota bacterium]